MPERYRRFFFVKEYTPQNYQSFVSYKAMDSRVKNIIFCLVEGQITGFVEYNAGRTETAVQRDWPMKNCQLTPVEAYQPYKEIRLFYNSMNKDSYYEEGDSGIYSF